MPVERFGGEAGLCCFVGVMLIDRRIVVGVGVGFSEIDISILCISKLPSNRRKEKEV